MTSLPLIYAETCIPMTYIDVALQKMIDVRDSNRSPSDKFTLIDAIMVRVKSECLLNNCNHFTATSSDR